MKMKSERALSTALVISLFLSLLIATPVAADVAESRDDEHLAKIDPRIRSEAQARSPDLVLVQVVSKVGANLERFFAESLTRTTEGVIAEDGADLPVLQFTTGFIPADLLLKVAARADVEAVIAPGAEPPQPLRSRPAPDLATLRARLEAKMAGVEGPTLPQVHGEADPNSWFEKTYSGYEEAWANGFTGDGVNVAVVDSGVDFAHPDLQGTQARVTDSASPYYGWPICFDDRSMISYVFNLRDARGNWGWFADTSAELTKYDWSPWVVWNDNRYRVPSTSLSGKVRMGWHPDDALADIWGEPIAILVTDENVAGVYDTVYVDLDSDQDFTDDKPIHKGDEISLWDADSDGYADLSGGMVYWIADGTNFIPGFDWVWSRDELYVPDAGDLVAFMINDVTESGGDHGTLVASNVAGQGIVNGGAPSWKPAYAGPGDGMIQAGARDAKIIAAGNFYEGGFAIDFYYFVAWGVDGLAGTRADQAQIVTQSYGSGATDDDRWDFQSRSLAYVTLTSSRVSWMESSGNGGSGMGTVTSPQAATGTYVGASTQYGVNRTFDSASAADQTLYGDVQSFSGRGPSAAGANAVSVLANGAWGAGALALNSWLDGWTAWDIWGGTSRSAPVAGGVMAMIYDAYRTANGLEAFSWPVGFWSTARDLLMAGSTFNSFPALTAGAGLVNAADSTNMAGMIHGAYTQPAFWDAGDYHGDDYLSFAHIVPQGESASKVFSVHNPARTPVTVDISDVYLREISVSDPFSFTTVNQRREDASFSKPDYLFEITDIIPPNTDLMIVRAIWPFQQFDADFRGGIPSSVTPPQESQYRLLVYDWTDVDGDGKLWNDSLGGVPGLVEASEIDTGEYVRYNYSYSGSPSQEVGVRDPLNRYHDGIFVGFRHRTLSDSIPKTNIEYRIWFYELVDWPMLTTDVSTLTVPAGGMATFTAMVTTTAKSPLGLYEGHIMVEQPAEGEYSAHTQAIPVVVSVSGDASEVNVLGGLPPAGTPYDNSLVRGYFDWGGSPESGDWRFYFLDQAVEPPPGSTLLINNKWEDVAPTDIDTLVLGPRVDLWSTNFPDFFHEYTLGTVGSSTRTGGRPEWLFYTATGGPEDWVSAPLSRGLHGIVHHNVLFAGDKFEVPFETIVGTARVNPIPAVFPVDSPSGAQVEITFQTSVTITGGLGGLAYGMSEDLSELAEWPAQNGDPWYWTKDILVKDAGVLEVALHDAESTAADTDLNVYVWNETRRQWDLLGSSGGASAEEYVNLVRPEDGLYRVEVHDYSETPGEQFVNIRRPQGKTIVLSGLPAGMIETDTTYTFDLNLNGVLGVGIYEGSVFVGPKGAETAIEVPVVLEVKERPTIYVPLSLKRGALIP